MEIQSSDRRSAEAKVYRRMYGTARWRYTRKAVLDRDGHLCQMCLREGRHIGATVVDHKIRHRGDEVLFYLLDNLWSLCKMHHDGAKQSEEIRGFSTAVGPDGFPIDPAHPANMKGR